MNRVQYKNIHSYGTKQACKQHRLKSYTKRPSQVDAESTDKIPYSSITKLPLSESYYFVEFQPHDVGSDMITFLISATIVYV